MSKASVPAHHLPSQGDTFCSKQRAMYSKSMMFLRLRASASRVALTRSALFSTNTRETQCVADSLIAAFKKRQEASEIIIQSRNFSFSGCGFLLPYHVGVARVLQELGFLQLTSHVAGASGGALVATAIAANVDLLQVQEDAKAMAASGRASGTWGQLEPGLRTLFTERFAHLDLGALEKRLTITTHQVWPKREIIHNDHFHSVDDLCDALIASCFIPFYLSRQATSKFRGEFHVDGGLVKIVPELPDHVRVCAFPAHSLRRPDYEISPSLDSEFPLTIWELARYSLFPAEPQMLDDLYELGRKAAVLWADKQITNESS